MTCYTKIGPDKTVICGHSITQHEGDESGMGGAEPCMVCGCQNFTREPAPEPELAELEGKCPTCGSNAPERHPAVQHEGEVHICRDPWHGSTHAGREALNKAIGHAWADQAYGPLPKAMPHNESMNPAYVQPVVQQGPATVYVQPEPGQNTRLQKWVDPAMFSAEPIDQDKGPQVHLLWMTPDPLAAIAGPSKMYKGETVRSFRDVTHAERHEFVQEIMKTKLQMPFEAVKFHFVIEGVTRAFTHQMVRQRTAAYAQRSDRFAVQEDGIPVALPPSLAGTTHEAAGVYDRSRLSKEEQMRAVWEDAVANIEEAYGYLLDKGMPQEDVRGLLPTNLLTTIHYITDLRALLDHGGNRLCTQAQFEWRMVFSRIRQAIREYNPYAGLLAQLRNLVDDDASCEDVRHCYESDRWQYETIAGLFKPVCYLTGKCEFKANFDRKCSIRERVDANAAAGRPSDEWGQPLTMAYTMGEGPDTAGPEAAQVLAEPIHPAEWLLRPDAAR